MELVRDLKSIGCGDVLENIDLRQYTTYKINGSAKILVMPKNEKQLIKLLKYIKETKTKYKVIGRGSNVVFVDKIYDGILIKLDNFNHLELDENTVTVGSGYDLIKLAIKTAKMGLSGLEFASGIPGSVGGAIFMNAGAYNSDMGYVVSKIKVLTPRLEIKTMYNKELNFHYRTSYLQLHPGFICLDVTFNLASSNKEDILDLINKRKERRLESQPLEFPSAGSVFRNPKDDFAGRLIEDLGYKGYRVKDVMVSEKHANFVLNMGSATGKELMDFILDIKDKVYEKYNIELKIEQEFIE